MFYGKGVSLDGRINKKPIMGVFMGVELVFAKELPSDHLQAKVEVISGR